MPKTIKEFKMKKQIYIFTNQVEIEATSKEEALKKFEDWVAISVLPDFMEPKHWDVMEVEAGDLDQYIDLP